MKYIKHLNTFLALAFFFILICMPGKSSAFSMAGFFSDVQLFATSKKVGHDACYERPSIALNIVKNKAVLTDVMPDIPDSRHRFGQLQGLANIYYGFNLVIETEVLRTPDMYCVRISGIEVLAGHRFPEIWIAPHIDAGSCEYDVTLEHEKQHIAVYHEHLDRFANALRLELGAILSGETYRIIDDNLDVRVMEESLKTTVFNYVSDIHAGLYRTARFQDFALDSPQEYRRLADLCR